MFKLPSIRNDDHKNKPEKTQSNNRQTESEIIPCQKKKKKRQWTIKHGHITLNPQAATNPDNENPKNLQRTTGEWPESKPGTGFFR